MKFKVRVKIFLFLFPIISACNSNSPQKPGSDLGPGSFSSSPNILVIVGDDMGMETLSGLNIGIDPAKTPNLDSLASRGVSFLNFWVQPTCSPTRATILTGRYGFRTGIGRPVGGPIGEGAAMGEIPAPPDKPAGAPLEIGGGSPSNFPVTWGLRSEEVGLPEAIKSRPDLNYSTAAIGKWHLADVRNGWENHPNLFGFDYFKGLLRGTPDSYFAWTEVENGEFIQRTGYNPSAKVDDALNWIEVQESAERPWFMWFSFNLPHTPLHLPPRELWVTDHSDLDPQANPNENSDEIFDAMLEAMDTEIGRLLDSIDEDVLANTYIVFIGDNGSTGRTIQLPYSSDHAKGSLYQGGLNVPLFIAGPGVPAGQTSTAILNSTDLYSTILDMAGIDIVSAVPANVTLDSVSFISQVKDPQGPPVRNWIYSDRFANNEPDTQDWDYAIRNNEYKLIFTDGREEFYDLVRDPYEENNLLISINSLTTEQQSNYRVLRRQVAELHASEE